MRWLSLVLILAASPGWALSCLRPDVARAYAQAEASEDVWIVVTGTLGFDERRLPAGKSPDPEGADIPARLTGQSLTPQGFTRPFDTPVTLRIACFGPWCGGARDGMPYLAFLRKEAGGHVAIAGPCGSLLFPQPTKAQLEQARRCMAGEACEASKGRR